MITAFPLSKTEFCIFRFRFWKKDRNRLFYRMKTQKILKIFHFFLDFITYR